MTQQGELKRVLKSQVRLTDEMLRTMYGDRLTFMALNASLAGFGLGLLMNRSASKRIMGAMFMATATVLELYAGMLPKDRRSKEPLERLQEEEEARAA